MENKSINDPGLGSKFNEGAYRLINRDGAFNVVKKNAVSGIRDVYRF